MYYYLPVEVYEEENCVKNHSSKLAALGSRALIVTGRRSSKINGSLADVTEALEREGREYVIFDRVEENPSVETVMEAREEGLRAGADFVVGVGGGSPLDASKAVAFMMCHRDRDASYLYEDDGEGDSLPVAAVPTTCGTGSEVTPFAVITDETTGVKYPLADYELLPNMAIIDADNMMTQPKGLTSASGIDALTHALEAYASIMATDYTDGLALKAMKNIFTYLPAAYDKGANDPYAREKMADASCMAGMAFANAFLGVCHSMAHKLGAFHHLPHGVANALMIEEVLRFNAAEVPTKMGTFPQYDHPHTLARYAEVADALNLPGSTDEEKLESLIQAVNELKARVGIKATIKDYNIDETDFLNRLDAMTEQAFDDQCTGANPRYPLMSEIKQMYLNAYYGTRPEEPKAADGKLTDVQEGDFKAAYRAEHKMQ